MDRRIPPGTGGKLVDSESGYEKTFKERVKSREKKKKGKKT